MKRICFIIFLLVSVTTPIWADVSSIVMGKCSATLSAGYDYIVNTDTKIGVKDNNANVILLSYGEVQGQGQAPITQKVLEEEMAANKKSLEQNNTNVAASIGSFYGLPCIISTCEKQTDNGVCKQILYNFSIGDFNYCFGLAAIGKDPLTVPSLKFALDHFSISQ